jgi:uncharacterized protein (DUF1786 family)
LAVGSPVGLGTAVRVLAVDVGCGTSDILLWDSSIEGENQTHLIVPSATCVVAAEIGEATRRGLPVVLAGPLMGGGPNMEAMKLHVARGLPFLATPSAAASFDDDLRVVAAMGVTVVEDDEIGGRAAGRPGLRGPRLRDAVWVRSGDLRFADLLRALSLVGADAPLDGCAVAVQDHGLAPAGVSDRVFRFEKITEALGTSGRLDRLFYEQGQIPPHFTRMRAVAGQVDPSLALVVGDTGPSAVWGAALAASATPCLAINFGNGHTLMAVVDQEKIDGLFEHHTSSLDPEKMKSYIRRFAAGALTSAEVFADGGHGVLPVSRPFDPTALEIVVTGPLRRRFTTTDLPWIEASLHGDMMLTGCRGLLRGYLAQPR